MVEGEPARLVRRCRAQGFCAAVLILGPLAALPAPARADIGEGASSAFSLYLASPYFPPASGEASAAQSAPFAVYLGPGFARPDDGEAASATSPPFHLYLASGFSTPADGAIASAISAAMNLYLGPGLEPPSPGGVAFASSVDFALYLAPLSERSAASPPFILDTRLPLAFTGTVSAASSSGGIPGALVELFHGSTRQQSTTTDGSGHFEFFATVHGDYVIRVSKSGFVMFTSDLHRFTGATITANTSLNALGGNTSTLVDLVIGTTDLTYTVVSSGALSITAMVHNNGAMPATNVRVRFFDASTGSGINEYVAITPDVVLPTLAPGEAKPVSVSWQPASGHQRFYAFADPDRQVPEVSELNNGSSKDLGAYGRQPPTVAGATCDFDGLDAPRQIGRFLAGVEGGLLKFRATVTDPDQDVVRVEFDFDGMTISDQQSLDGWAVSFDPGRLSNGTRPLLVTAFDAAGLVSQPFRCDLIVDSKPAWSMGTLVTIGKNETHQGVGAGVEYKDGYMEFTVRVPNSEVGLPGDREPLFIDVTHDNDIAIIRDTKTQIAMGLYLKVSKPLRPTLPWKVSGFVRRTETLFDRDFNSSDIGLSAVISADGQRIESIALDYSGEVSWSTPEVMWPVGAVGPFPISAGLSADLTLAVNVFGTFALGCTSFELGADPSVAGRVNGIARVGFPYANLQLVLAPRLTFGLQLRYLHPPDDLTASGSLALDISGKLVGRIGKWPLEFSGDLLKFQLGPWDQQWNFTAPQNLESPAPAADSISLPELFALPSSAVSSEGRIGIAYVADADASPSVARPEIYFVESTPQGDWGPPVRSTTLDLFKSSPAAAYLGLDPLMVWTQSSVPQGDVPPEATLSWVLDRQDLWWSRRVAGDWSAPQALVADLPGAARADGPPTLAALNAELLAAWARSSADSALTEGSSEIVVSRYNGAEWTAATGLTNDSVTDMSPAACGLRGDSALIVWLRSAEPFNFSLSYSIGTSISWGTSSTVAPVAGDLREPCLVRLPGQGALAAWVLVATEADSTLLYRLMVSFFDEQSGAWSSAQEVFRDEHFIESPILRLDQRGIVALLWRGYAGADGDLMVALKDLRQTGSAWTSPRPISNDGFTDWMATAGIDGENNLHVVDLKSDLSPTASSSQPAANFVQGLTLTRRGITNDLSVNEQLNFGYRPISPDLRLEPAAISADRDNAAVGETLHLSARVDNIGDVQSALSSVTFYDGAPDSGGVPLPSGTVPLATIEPDSSLVVQLPWTVTPGPHRLYAVADVDQQVPEQTESNNRSFLALGILPDLTVDSLTFFDANPRPGAPDSAVAHVRNAGGAAAPPFSLEFHRGTTPMGSSNVGGLEPGAALRVPIPFTASAGMDTIAVVVDPEEAVGEQERSNNTATALLAVLPDLVVAADSIAYESNGILKAVVMNAGGMSSSAFAVSFYAGDPRAGGTLIGSVPVDSVSAFETRIVTSPWQAPLGTTTVFVLADLEEVITERGRENNVAYHDVLLGALSDLTVLGGSIEVVPTSAPPFVLQARILNRGSAHALGVGVEFFRGDPAVGGTKVGEQLLPTVALGETLNIMVEWAAPDSVSNPIYVVIDRANGILEQDETNNQTMRLFGSVVGVPEGQVLPSRFALHHAGPNPFTGQTDLAFDLPTTGFVEVALYDLAGRRVRLLAKGTFPAGFHSRVWDGCDDQGREVAPGVYFVRMIAVRGEFRSKLVKL